MVQRASDNPVVQEHYAAQVGLTAAVLRALSRLRSPRPVDAVASLAQEFSDAAISLAVDYYEDLREYEGVPGTYRPPLVRPWDVESLQAYIDAASTNMLQAIDAEAAALDAEIDAFASQLVLDAGTREIFAAIDNDPRPTRYARVTRPGACSFCLMLAVRGAVYRSEDTASFRPHTSPGLCQCDVQPVWGAYEAPAHIRAAESLYVNSVEDSMTSAEKRNAFRRALYAERK